MAFTWHGANIEQTTDDDVYSACVVNVFVLCVRQLMAYRSTGFTVTACIPHAGRLHGRPARETADSYVLYKEFIADVNSLSVSLTSSS